MLWPNRIGRSAVHTLEGILYQNRQVGEFVEFDVTFLARDEVVFP
jgi:hypothetical protein